MGTENQNFKKIIFRPIIEVSLVPITLEYWQINISHKYYRKLV